MQTEQQNPRTQQIDQLPTLDMLQLINDEDASVAQAVRQVLPEIARAVDEIAARMRQGGRLIYVGAGTSGRLAMIDAVECVPTYSTPPELVQAIIAGGNGALIRSVEGAEDDVEKGRSELLALQLTPNDSVVGIAASGRTPYVIAALEAANELNALTVGIACNDPSKLLDTAQIKIGVVVGPEVVTGSTRMKAGTAQKMVLNMLSTGVMVRLGKVYGNLMVDVQVTNQKLADRAQRIVAQVTGVTYEEAGNLLQKAENNVKAAIVMHRRQVDLNDALRLLKVADGRLGMII